MTWTENKHITDWDDITYTAAHSPQMSNPLSARLETTPPLKHFEETHMYIQHNTFFFELYRTTRHKKNTERSRAGCTIAGGSTQTDKLLRWWWWWWWWWWCGGCGACAALDEGGKGGSKSACAPVEKLWRIETACIWKEQTTQGITPNPHYQWFQHPALINLTQRQSDVVTLLS